MKPRFELDTHVLQFSKGLQLPLGTPTESMQVSSRTAAGTLQGEDLGPDIYKRELPFKNLPQSDYDALLNWYDNICNGLENEFTYYDEVGDDMLVVMISNPRNDLKQTSYQRYIGTVLLEVVG